MPRSKVKVAFIEDYKARKTSFMKRKESLKKKLHELSVLCNIEACSILYSPFASQPEVWPDNTNVVHNVLREFMNKSPIEKSKHMVNQDSYIKERMNKVKEQINKQIMVNRELELANMMSQCLSGKMSLASLNLKHLNDLVLLAGNKVLEVEERIEVLKSEAYGATGPPELHLSQVEGSRNTASNVVAGGMDEDAYVPVMENNGGLDEMQGVRWYPPDWIGNDLLEHGLDFASGFDTMMSSPDRGPNPKP
ncbi:hypothetical protein QVD17_18183 [Tagetes erecta]|uniref:MADS-box domain-containing protein n=1 Tax=Tagetes erecta TaxID=13708 RepID=A0AAD8KH42_TARER|nr:hypothetical protein QVD17_18183 [Tagetes erecta]